MSLGARNAGALQRVPYRFGGPGDGAGGVGTQCKAGLPTGYHFAAPGTNGTIWPETSTRCSTGLKS